MQVLKQSTITTILVGPVLDASGVAVTTAAIGDFNITKNGTSAAMSGNTINHSHNGHYTIALTAANTDTLGRLTVSVNNAAMAMAPFRFTVLAAAAFDALVTNGNIASSTSGRTIAVDVSGAVNAELDAAARVKLHGTQDDYAPLKASDYTAPLTAAGTRTALGMSAADLDSQLDAILAAASAGAGTGARTVTITVNDGTNVLQNAVVRFTEGANTFRALTNASGVAVFNLDDATYTVAITKSGYSYAGTTMVVNGTETATYSMTAITTTPPDDPVLCTVTIPIRSQYGSALIGEPVDIRFESFVDGAEADAVVLSPPPALTSNSDGNVIVDLYRLAKYKVIYGDEEYVETIKFTTPDSGSYVVTEA